VIYCRNQETTQIPAIKVKVMNTTAAVDAFIGFLLSELRAGRNTQTALKTAITATAICITRQGAATSIHSF